MFTHPPRFAIALGVGLAGLLALAISAPSSANTRITYGPLVPVAPINALDASVGVSACPDPDSAARITDAYPAQRLKAVAAQSTRLSVQVVLDLDSMGNLLQARISNASGNMLLDQQALIAARGSKYAPEVRNCNSFKRSYLLDITFDAPAVSTPSTASR